jgi:hypothetical protein
MINADWSLSGYILVKDFIYFEVLEAVVVPSKPHADHPSSKRSDLKNASIKDAIFFSFFIINIYSCDKILFFIWKVT